MTSQIAPPPQRDDSAQDSAYLDATARASLPVAPRTRFHAALFALLVGITGQGCLETTFRPDPKYADVDVDLEIAADAHDDGEIADSAVADSATVDSVLIDSTGDVDASDLVDTEAPDSDQPDVAGDADAFDAAETVVLLPFAATCAADAACSTGLCLGHPGGQKVCTNACEGDCPVGYRCGLAPATGSSLHFCLPLPGNLCKPCTDDLQCPDGACLSDLGGADPVCGVSCAPAAGGEAACPAGFVCQSFLKGELCVPANGSCACGTPQLGQAWSCAVKTPLGSCTGSQVCVEGGWSKCSASLPAIETCDGYDNNCDGKTDEGFTLASSGGAQPLGAPCGVGVCAGGKVVCAPGGQGTACSTAPWAASIDLCGDKVDNNCNGQTDEACPEADTDGDKVADSQDCAPYDGSIYPGAKEVCCKALAPASGAKPVPIDDTTKGCDWNCDGNVLACAPADKDGDSFDSPGDCDDNDPTAFPGGKEKCDDGKDQDCDGADLSCTGLTDADSDGYPLGIDCNDDAPKIYPGAAEACNFLDDDCDGLVDEGNPGGVCSDGAAKTATDCSTAGGQWSPAGAACGSSIGACTPGVLACNHIGLSANVTCVDAVLGSDEICNGADDDCDGDTDEPFPGLGKSCDGDDADQCAFGTQVCAVDGKSTTCGPESTTDLLELCDPVNPAKGNNKDEDCDGETDEVCWSEDVDGDGVAKATDCNDADAGVFPGAKNEPCCDPAYAGGAAALDFCDKNCDGQVTWCAASDKDFDGKTGGDDCDESNPGAYLGAIEKCDDGIDQDCDKKDLKCAEISDGDGDGYAAAVDCNDNNKEVHPGAFEKCNLKDDDCDGFTDEGNPEAAPTACGADQGICKPGKEVCVRQQFKASVLCVPVQGPQAELCNGLDDNCNGSTDETYPEVGQPCDSKVDADACQTGTWTCKAGGAGTECVNELTPNLVELCDGQDNDCDGETDEGMSYFGKAVGDGCDGQGACGVGKVVCSQELAVAVCSTDLYGSASEAKAELCNAIDDDCDGLTDEGQLFAGKAIGQSCAGSGACANKTGLVECGPDSLAICSTMPGGSAYAGIPEVCNGVDDDCDGRVDEGLGLADSSCKVAGICTPESVKAQCIAGAWKCDYSVVTGYQGDKEVLCDGIDNDCDGKTDDEFAVGTICDGQDSDKCSNGTVVCSGDKLFSQCGLESPADIIDVCNGVDDDCDGQTDEDYPVGQSCDGDDDDKCPTGTWTCKTDATAAECVNEPPSNQSELCNGKDDDCDGETDEGFQLGVACDGDDSDSCKNGAFVCAANNKTATCGKETVESISEICNGDDDDCDGSTDEGQVYEGGALGAACNGIGSCGKGSVVCSPNSHKATCSTNPDAYLIFDGKELCDGLDNDCNGLTDDALTWKGVELGKSCPGVGQCTSGLVECGNDKQVTCSTLGNGSNPKAKPETCDGLDNDCNGITDDGLGLSQSPCSAKGVCTPEATIATCTDAKWICDYSKISGWQQVETLCDGLDNDCDGQTDEGFDVGKACDGDDTDQCKNGTWQCAGDNKSAVCTNESLTSIPEVCDSLDNDCDGFTDENFTYGDVVLGAPCDGAGECGTGKVICGKVSKVAVCSTDPDGTSSQSKSETCDNKDNDCDGVTDNGMKFQGLPKGAPCSGEGECGLGVVECNPIKKVPVCSSNPDGTESKSIFEQCNGKDDDCDGQSDEDVDPSTNNCVKQGACAKALVPTCSGSKWKCQYSGAGYQATETFCDDIDNDCNGITDDNYNQKGKVCDGDDADTCKNGKLICGGDKASLVCGPEEVLETTEVCDGIDNDCNGQTDETFPTLGQACDGTDSDKCKNGVFTCATNKKSVTCASEFPSDVKETCDGVDNDCDGLTDEGFDVGSPCDGPDADLCKLGKVQCDKQGNAECGTESKSNVTEICNEIDDDCDGTTDEGFEQKGYKCDSPADTDLCKTGQFACSQSGVLVCANDMECAVGTACQQTASNNLPEKCLCGGSVVCSFATGDDCNAGKCTCNGGATCPSTKVCVPGKGCQ